MKEEFLHYTWKYRLFDQQALRTTDGTVVEVLSPGLHNFDSGPDFFNARLKMNGQVWAGNVEIHVFSSDWIKHGHRKDPAYDNVILHVVFGDDAKIKTHSGAVLPALELKNRIDKQAYSRYLQLQLSTQTIPCKNQIREVKPVVISSWLDRLLVERLEERYSFIHEKLSTHHFDWEELFYQALARNFGFNVNAQPFESLARSLPLKVIAKHRNSLFQLEALFLGQAGFLEAKFRESYPKKLRKEYEYLRQKFELVPAAVHTWKFMRMRPSNFPTIRISQFAALLHSTPHLFSRILEIETISELKKLLAAPVSVYWNHHYRLGHRSVKKEKQIGNTAIELLLVNTLVPFLFVYGRSRGEERFGQRALRFLEGLGGGSNSIIEYWKDLDLPVRTAHDTQALLQLKKNYCDRKRCLQCAIGTELLKNKEPIPPAGWGGPVQLRKNITG
jgi:hypothetical protein